MIAYALNIYSSHKPHINCNERKKSKDMKTKFVVYTLKSDHWLEYNAVGFIQTPRTKEASEEGQQRTDGGRSQATDSDRQVDRAVKDRDLDLTKRS